MTVPELRLLPRHDRRALSGHPWVFSNELVEVPRELPAGSAVDVLNDRGRLVGRGYFNPHSLIAVRLLANTRVDLEDPGFWAGRLREALAWRRRLWPERAAQRVVHAEGDRLPGLVVDHYGDVLAVQLGAAGIDRRREVIAEALQQVFPGCSAVLRNEGRHRELEGLPEERAVWFGEPPDQVRFDEWGVPFCTQPLGGQKTGHFFDQALNRHALAPFCGGARVLDAYCHTGGFGLHALAAGAREVVFLDRSEEALAGAEANAALQGAGERCRLVHGEGKKSLEQLTALGQRFQVVNVDPPAFAKTRKVANAALRGYQDVAALAIALVEPGGIFAMSSCSHHVEEDRFAAALVEAAATAHRRLRLVRRGEQSPDHPIRLEIPETRYLKHYVFQVELAR